MQQVSNYSFLSRFIHLARALLVFSCYLCCYSYVVVSYLFTDYIGKLDFYKIHTTHKFLGIILLIFVVVGLVNRVKNGFAFQTSDTGFEKLAKRVFFSLMYLVMFTIVFSGMLANYEPNILFVKAPIFLEGLSTKLVFYKMHTTIVKFALPLMVCMHMSMALLRFFDKKRHHAKMFRKNKETENITLH